MRSGGCATSAASTTTFSEEQVKSSDARAAIDALLAKQDVERADDDAFEGCPMKWLGKTADVQQKEQAAITPRLSSSS